MTVLPGGRSAQRVYVSRINPLGAKASAAEGCRRAHAPLQAPSTGFATRGYDPVRASAGRSDDSYPSACRSAVRNCHVSRRHVARPSGAQRALRVFYENFLEHLVVQGQFGNQTFESLVIFFQAPNPAGFGNIEPAELAAPLVERRVGYRMLRQSPDTFTPASACLRIPMICSSVKWLFIMTTTSLTESRTSDWDTF